MRCLITGASGHLGAAVTRRFVEAGAEVHVLARPESDLSRLGEAQGRVKVIVGELADPARAAEAIREAAPEVLVHTAWGGVVRETRDLADPLITNVTGTLKLFQIARDAGCRAWVGIGSQAEYGPLDGPAHEEMRCRPTTGYGAAKHSLGTLLEALCAATAVRFVWLRLFATYGPCDDPRRLIPSTIESLLDGRVPPLTPGEQRWDYLYVDDAADAIFRVAAAPEVSGVFNLASGRAVPVREIVERVRDLIDPAMRLGFGEVAYPPGQTMLLQGNIARLAAAAGWSPRTGMEEGLGRTVQWHRAQRNTRRS